MEYSKKSNYLFSIDALRVIAILAVIMIHITTKTLATLHIDVASAPVSLFLNQASRFAVPLFFLISGFVLELNNRNLSYVDFFKKRASRIFIPFLFWSTIYFVYANGYSLSGLLSLKFLTSILLGTASYHLYFIPTLIIFYLAFPFLHKTLKILKNPFVLFTIITLQLVLLYQDYYVKQLDIFTDLRIAILCFAMFLLGMVGSHYIERVYSIVKRFFLAFIVMLIILPPFIFLHVYDLTIKYNTSRFIYNQYSPLNYIYTVIIAVTLFYILEKTQFMRRFFVLFSKLSFFVFFIHVLVQYLLWDNLIAKIFLVNGNSILKNFWFDPLIFTFIALVSFGVAYVIHKIPYASKITG